MTADTTRFPVIICGGGPVGLALALDLGWRGMRCMLVEQGDGQRVQPKMLTTSVRTLEFCRRWGIDRRVKNWGLPDDYALDNVVATSISGYEIARQRKPAPRDTEPLPQSPETERHCPQTWFDPILRDAAAAMPGVELRHGMRLTGFAHDEDGVRVALEDAETGRAESWEAGYLIGCDGFHSIVRDGLGISMSGRGIVDKSVNLAIRLPDFDGRSAGGGVGRYVLIGEEGTWATFVAVDGRELWRMTLYGRSDFDPFEADHHVCIRRALGGDMAYEPLNVERWTRRALVADSYGRDRVWLAGDAVHAMPPNGGFGMNTGIADAADLGWKLAATVQGWGGAGLASSYETERRPVGLRAVAEALRDYDRLTADTRFPHITEDSEDGHAVRAALEERLSASMRRSWEPVGIHLGYRYDDSPVILPDGTPPPDDDEMHYIPTARPGSRAPHCWLADGRSTLDLFGREFTLLVLDGTADAMGLAAAARERGVPLSVVTVDDERARALYEAPLVLVRPDGHVAWRGDGTTKPRRVIDVARGAA